MDNLILEIPCTDRKGEGFFQVKILREFHRNYSMTPAKIAELWKLSSAHEVLFSDETMGKVDPFVLVAINPASAWLEIAKDEQTVGVAYITSVKLGFDADAHFAFWDGIAGGRESVILMIAEWLMDRYKLKRLSASTPPYQGGTIRFIKSLGFVQEGVKRDAVFRHGELFPLIEFGMTRGELDSALRKAW